MTEWREIPRYPYKINEHGEIVNSKGCRLRGKFGRKGYKEVTLVKDGSLKQFRVHRLVALVFLGCPPNGKNQAAHNDGDKKNNHYSNLRWVSNSENVNDRISHGLKSGYGYKSNRRNLTVQDVIEIREKLASGATRKRLAVEYGCTPENLYYIAKGKTWSYLLK